MPQLLPYKGDYYLWKYLPSIAAAVIFIVLFSLATVAHSMVVLKKRTWFSIYLATGGISEVVGFCFRAAAYANTASLIFYILQAVLILIAPLFFAASIYMSLGRLINLTGGGHLTIIPVRWITGLFVFGDMLSMTIQSAAAPLLTADHGKYEYIGNDGILAGLAVQIFSFGLFIVTAIHFHYRATRAGPPITQDIDQSWRTDLKMLYTVSALIMLRSIYRIIEYILGDQQGYLVTNEWPLYVFDAAPMFLVLAIFYWWFPKESYARGSPLIEMGSAQGYGKLR